MGGGYTANNVTYTFKTYTRHTPKGEKKERERNKNLANQVILGTVSISKIELYTCGIL